MSRPRQKLFSANAKIGFLAHADKFGAALAKGDVLAPAKNLAQMQQVIINDRIDAALCVVFLGVVLSMLVFALLAMRKGLRQPQPTVQETVAATEVVS